MRCTPITVFNGRGLLWLSNAELLLRANKTMRARSARLPWLALQQQATLDNLRDALPFLERGDIRGRQREPFTLFPLR